ncbi:MAG: short-chain dehydrogenase, partial [Actinocatenispora sp.]
MTEADDLTVCLRVLQRLRTAPTDDPDRLRVERAVAGFVKDGKRTRRAARRRAATAADAAVLT